jgi:histone H3/H4
VTTERDVFLDSFVPGILHRISPGAKMADMATRLVQQASQDFVKTLTAKAAELAQLRGSDTLQACDVHFALRTLFRMDLPGSGLRPFQPRPTAHYTEQRDALLGLLSRQGGE